MILVTGGAGFIGSNFVLDWIAASDESIINLDKLTYAGNLENLASLKGNPRHKFVRGDIGDRALVRPIVSSKTSLDDLSKATRESAIETIGNLTNVFGGKWTSAMRLGRKVSDQLLKTKERKLC